MKRSICGAYRCSCSLHAYHSVRFTPSRPLRHTQLPRSTTAATTQDSKERGSPPQRQEEPKQPSPSSSSSSSSGSPVWVQELQSKWETLDTAQRAYAVVAGLAALALTPKLLTLAVLGVERVIIGGLLVVEEALLELLFRGGAVVGAVGVVGLVLAGIYLFLVPRATK